MTGKCEACVGSGMRSIRAWEDCSACNGTGWADGKSRLTCERCGVIELTDEMHVSPDEDGNRIVCLPCLELLEVRYA